jgi:putative transposase
LKRSPLQVFLDGLYHKTGLPPIIQDKKKVKLDFLPYVLRTVQESGIVVDYIHYQADVLRPWVHALAEKSPKSKQKKKFIFKRDPRDISVLFFYDPEIECYFEIPYHDLLRPPITLWEHRHVLTKLANNGVKDINEDILFDEYEVLRAIEEKAVTQTRIVRQQRQRAKTQSNKAKSIKQELGLNKLLPSDQAPVGNGLTESVPVRLAPSLPTDNILPFDELEYGTFD